MRKRFFSSLECCGLVPLNRNNLYVLQLDGWFSRDDTAARPTAGDGFFYIEWSTFVQDAEKDTARKMANIPGPNQKQNKSEILYFN